MGPESAKSFPGRDLVPARDPTTGGHAIRATQELDYGRRGKGYVFGAFRPADGAAFTAPYASRSAANWADFLVRVDAWLPPDTEAATVYAIVDNLAAHRATDVLLFSLAHPRWEFVFQPTDAAYRRCLPQPHRALVEGAPLAGAQGPLLRHLGRRLPGRA
jgi:hypothetical protein